MWEALAVIATLAALICAAAFITLMFAVIASRAFDRITVDNLPEGDFNESLGRHRA